jgi:hypothetical protein
MAVDVPGIVERFAAREPVNRSQIPVEPASSQGEVNLSVPVNVEGGDAHVVALGGIGNDDPLFPVGVLIPEYPILGDGDDVGFFCRRQHRSAPPRNRSLRRADQFLFLRSAEDPRRARCPPRKKIPRRSEEFERLDE